MTPPVPLCRMFSCTSRDSMRCKPTAWPMLSGRPTTNRCWHTTFNRRCHKRFRSISTQTRHLVRIANREERCFAYSLWMRVQNRYLVRNLSHLFYDIAILRQEVESCWTTAQVSMMMSSSIQYLLLFSSNLI